jgi:hypothetical protein
MAISSRRTSGRPRALGTTVEKLTRPIFGKRGFSEAAIVTDWASVIGAELARHTRPERIAFARHSRSEGTLHLRVANSGLALELQHLEPQLIERINRYFGYRAVARVSISQGPVRSPEEKPVAPEKTLDPVSQKALESKLSNVTDPDLRMALERLGQRILAGEGNR